MICHSEWKITINDKEVLAIEDAGIHMCLKKLALLDKSSPKYKMGEAVINCLNEETVRPTFYLNYMGRNAFICGLTQATILPTPN